MGKEDAAVANVTGQKFISAMSKLRQTEDKVVKALPTWTQSEPDDTDESSNFSLVSFIDLLAELFSCLVTVRSVPE